MANIWGQDMRPMGSAGMAGGYSALSPAINSGVYFPQTRSVQSSLIPPNTQAPSLAGTPSILSGMTGSQYQTPPMAGQPWPQAQPVQPRMNQMSRFASYMQPQLAGQQRGTNQQASNPWWNQGRYNIGGQGADMAMRRRPPQIGGGGVRRFDQQGGGFPWNTGGYAPGGSSPLNDSLWQALQQRGFGTIPGGAPDGWTAYQLANGNIEYKQPGGGQYYRYDPNQGWYDSRNLRAGYTSTNPFANMNPGGSVATSAAY